MMTGDLTGVVGGAGVPHAPQFFTLPDTEDKEQVWRVEERMRALGEELQALRPDAVVVIANDHLKNFLLYCVPAFLVHRGPRASGTFAGRSFSWPVDSELAMALIESLQEQGFDPAASMNCPIGYEFGIPLTFLGLPPDTPIVPIFVNSYVPPQPSPDRCYAFGQALARGMKLLGKRVVVVASGGLSHYPGTERYANPDMDTDKALLEQLRGGNLRALLQMGAHRLDRTGNVEARSWIILAGALGERPPTAINFEPSWHHNYAIVAWTGEAGTERRLESATPLHYPVPRADQVGLYEALYKLLCDEAACAAFCRDPAAFAGSYELRQPERDALVALDEAAMRELGVHPLLVFLARLQVDLVRT